MSRTAAVGELRGRADRAACGRAARGLVQRRRDLGRRAVGGEREVARPLLAVAHDGGEAAVQVAARARAEPHVRRRREQRVREPQAVALGEQEPGVHRVVDRARPRRRLDQRERRIGERRDHGQHLLHLGRLRVEALLHETLQRVRNRQRAVRVERVGAAAERPRQLERVERVAARRRVEALEDALRERQRRAGRGSAGRSRWRRAGRGEAARAIRSATASSNGSASGRASPDLRPTRNDTGLSPSRRTAKPSAAADAPSIHCASSIATSSGSSSASDRSAPSVAAAIVCASGPASPAAS